MEEATEKRGKKGKGKARELTDAHTHKLAYLAPSVQDERCPAPRESQCSLLLRCAFACTALRTRSPGKAGKRWAARRLFLAGTLTLEPEPRKSASNRACWSTAPA